MSVSTIGASVKRREDKRFLTGKGNYTDDMNRPGQAYAYILRSPHAYAQINGIDLTAAKAAPGVESEAGGQFKNNGVLLIVAPNERKVRIEVGYGLEPVITDAYSSVIIQNAILPAFREGDYQTGIVKGTDEIIAQLSADRGTAIEKARQVAQQPVHKAERFPVWIIIVVVLFLIIFGRGWLPFFILEALLRGGGGGGWSGGGGGGGFSGGGGSFGGGGSSGSW